MCKILTIINMNPGKFLSLCDKSKAYSHCLITSRPHVLWLWTASSSSRAHRVRDKELPQSYNQWWCATRNRKNLSNKATTRPSRECMAPLVCVHYVVLLVFRFHLHLAVVAAAAAAAAASSASEKLINEKYVWWNTEVHIRTQWQMTRWHRA